MTDGVQFVSNLKNGLKDVVNTGSFAKTEFQQANLGDIFSEVKQEEFLDNIAQYGIKADDAKSLWNILDADQSGDINNDEYSLAMGIFGTDTDDDNINDAITGQSLIGNALDLVENPDKLEAMTGNYQAGASDVTSELHQRDAKSDANTELAADSQEQGPMISAGRHLAKEAAKAMEETRQNITDAVEQKAAEQKAAAEEAAKQQEPVVEKSPLETIAEGNDKVQKDEATGEHFVTIESWSSEQGNIGSIQGIIENVYGKSFDSPEGQDLLNKLTEKNPDAINPKNLDLVYVGSKIKLVDPS